MLKKNPTLATLNQTENDSICKNYTEKLRSIAMSEEIEFSFKKPILKDFIHKAKTTKDYSIPYQYFS